MLRPKKLYKKSAENFPMPPSIVTNGMDGPSWTILTDKLGLNIQHRPQASACDADIDCSLALSVYTQGSKWESGFDLWARSKGIPALSVQTGINEVIIGPLALPERCGCGYCAHARMIAASAPKKSQPQMLASFFSMEPAAISLLADELQTILQHGSAASSLMDHVVMCDLESGAISRHRVIPLPWCPICGGASQCKVPAEAGTLSSTAEPEKLLRQLDGWVDPFTGVISCIQFEVPENGRQVPIIATTSPPYILRDDGSLRQLPVGWGKGLGISEAILSTVGEAIERYSASLPDPAKLIWKRCDQLEGNFLDPRETALYSETQYEDASFPFVRFDPNILHPWILGTWGHSCDPVWIPAVLVYLFFRGEQAHIFAQGTSNGLAASTTKEDAAFRAVLELVERDAFMTAWLTGTPGQRIILDETLDPELAEVLGTIEELGASVELYVLPDCALGTTVLCLALGDGVRYPGVTIGLSADLDPQRAVRQAILELAQTGPYLCRMMVSQRLRVPERPEAVREMIDHAAYYFPATRADAFKRIRNNETHLALRDLCLRAADCERSIGSCAAALRSLGIRVAIVDVTSPDLFASPFRVVRAISPDLQPNSYGYGLDFDMVHRVRAKGVSAEIPPIHPIW